MENAPQLVIERGSAGSGLKALLVWFDGRTSFDRTISDDQRFVSNLVHKLENSQSHSM